ncbi:MAG: hypothetical protein AB9835_14465 [Eubacteriales bacterium]
MKKLNISCKRGRFMRIGKFFILFGWIEHEQCKHKTADGHCTLHSDSEVKEYCVEGPCPDEAYT